MKKPTLKKIESKNTNTENLNKQSQENGIINIEHNEQPIKSRQEMRGGRKEIKNNKGTFIISQRYIEERNTISISGNPTIHYIKKYECCY